MPEAADTNATPPSGAQPGVFIDPYRAYNFKLEINGITEGHFTECCGMEVAVQPIRYREGGDGVVVHALHGRVEYSDVTLRYGLTASREMWDWFMRVVRGERDVTQNISIVMLETDGSTEAMRWDLFDAWPCRWRGAPLDALRGEVAIESVTFAFNRMERA